MFSLETIPAVFHMKILIAASIAVFVIGARPPKRSRPGQHTPTTVEPKMDPEQLSPLAEYLGDSPVPEDLFELLAALVSSETMGSLLDCVGFDTVNVRDGKKFLRTVSWIIDQIGSHYVPNRHVRTLFIEHPKLNDWGVQMAFMASIPFNMGSGHIANRAVGIDLLSLYEKYLRVIEPKDSYRPIPAEIMDIWGYGMNAKVIQQQSLTTITTLSPTQSDIIGTPTPDDVLVYAETVDASSLVVRRPRKLAKGLFKPRRLFTDRYEESYLNIHEPNECAVCSKIVSGRVPLNEVHALIDAVLESSDSEPGLLVHINDVIRILSAQKVESMCEKAELIIRKSYRAILEMEDGEKFFSGIAPTLQFARKCIHNLSLDLRGRMIPQILLRVAPDIAYNVPGARKVQVPQLADHVGAFELISQRILQLVYRTDYSQLQVTLEGSEALGIGPLVALIARAVEDAVNDLFEYSDEREVLYKPRAGQGDKLRAFGRLLGLVILHEVPIKLPLTNGALAVLVQADLDAIPCMEWLKLEDPQKHKGLENLLKNGVSELEGENVEDLIRRVAREVVIDSVKDPMNLILRGVYDVMPFGELSWLQAEELGETLAGRSGPIDAELLKHHTEYDEKALELEWFWDIVANDLDSNQIAKLLEFSTGARHAPFKREQWMQVRVTSSDLDRLPTSQLCLRQLKLSRYSSREALKAKLLWALLECTTIDNL